MIVPGPGHDTRTANERTTMPDYGNPGRLAREVDKAIARDNARPRPPLPPLCGIDGCPLPAGHVERAGSPHRPPLVAEDVEHYDTLRDSIPTDLDHIDPQE